MNVWRLEGAPFTSNWSATATHNQAGVWGIDGCKTTNVKPAGLLAVNDTLYLGVTCVGIGRQSDGQHRQSNIAGGLAVSTDFGETFRPAAAKFFTGRLASPQLINRGKGHSAASDHFVYAHFCYGIDNKSFWDANSHVLVGRVPEHEILSRASWRFYTAAGGWDADDAEAAPVMSFPDSLSQNQATYSQTLDRYLIANTAYLDPVHRRPVSYRNPSDGSQKGIQLSMFESPTPWGPWALFYDWTQPCPGGRCLPPFYTPSFPAPFVDDAHGPLLGWAAPCDPPGGMHRPWVCQRYALNGSGWHAHDDGSGFAGYALNLQRVELVLQAKSGGVAAAAAGTADEGASGAMPKDGQGSLV